MVLFGSGVLLTMWEALGTHDMIVRKGALFFQLLTLTFFTNSAAAKPSRNWQSVGRDPDMPYKPVEQHTWV